MIIKIKNDAGLTSFKAKVSIRPSHTFQYGEEGAELLTQKLVNSPLYLPKAERSVQRVRVEGGDER